MKHKKSKKSRKPKEQKTLKAGICCCKVDCYNKFIPQLRACHSETTCVQKANSALDDCLSVCL